MVMMVAVPARPGADGQLFLESRHLPDGVVLPVFGSVRDLVAALGQSQPWAVLPLDKVRAIAAEGGADRLMLDPRVGDDAWRWTRDDLNGFSWPGEPGVPRAPSVPGELSVPGEASASGEVDAIPGELT